MQISPDILEQALANRTPDQQWKEGGRRTPAESYGKPVGTDLNAVTGQEIIGPDGLGDEYVYGIEFDRLRLSFYQSIYNCMPAANHQFLTLYFGDAPTDNSAAYFDSHYRDSKIRFETELGRLDWDLVDLLHINTDLCTMPEGWGERSALTPSGITFMEKLVAVRAQLLAIPGFSSKHDQATFRNHLDEIIRAFHEETLYPLYWST